MTLLLIIGAVLAIAVIGVLLAAAAKPDVFTVERSTGIRASADALFPLINDMHAFNTWNPYNRKDPNMVGTYSGPPAGAGARYAFSGDKSVGKGSLLITGSAAPQQVHMQLEMSAPMACLNDITFRLEPRPGADGITDVTWRMSGPCPFMGKVMGVVFNMDKMVGRDFDNGLANLKAQAETA